MNLAEYNRLRAPTDSGPLLAWIAIVIALLGGLAQSTLVVVAAIAIAIFILVGLSVRSVRRLNRADQFRCPNCGNTPHQWVAPDPSDDSVCTHYQTDVCLHCRWDLRRPDDGGMTSDGGPVLENDAEGDAR